MERYLEVAPFGSAPTAPAANPGYPTNGNPSTGTPASEPGEWWFHMISEELRAVIVAAGIVPDHAVVNQLLQALEALYSPVGYALLAVAQTFTKAQRGAEAALPATTGTITLDLNTSNNFGGALTGNSILANPTNQTVGQSGVIRIVNGATPYTLAFGTYWKFPSGVVPALTNTAGATDDLCYYVESPTRILANLQKDVK